MKVGTRVYNNLARLHAVVVEPRKDCAPPAADHISVQYDDSPNTWTVPLAWLTVDKEQR